MSEELAVEGQLDDLTEKAVAAHGLGQRDEAQKLFDRRDRLVEGDVAGEVAGEVETGADEGSGESAEIPEPIAQDISDNLMAQLREAGLDEEVDQLEQEWGRDVGANLAYAADFMTRFGEANPAFGAAVDREVERDSIIYPAVLRIAASLGRELVHGDRGQEKGQEQMTGNKSAALDDKLTELTEEALRALNRGEKRNATKLFAERDKVAERLYGNEPIVGGEGRNI